MYKIDLTSYNVQVRTRNEKDKDKVVPKLVVYDVKSSLVGILFHPSLRLNGREVLVRDEIACRIETCKDSSILLEESEYLKFKEAVDKITGLGRNEVELVKRILDAPTVDIKEVKGKKNSQKVTKIKNK